MKMSEDENCWVTSELESIDLGDVRLKGRAIKILKGLSESPQSSIPESIGEWTDLHGAYRFFDNDKVDSKKILDAHYDSTIDRCSKHKIVIVAHDTSSLNFFGLEKTHGLGKVGDSTNNPHTKGLIMHTAYAITPDRLALGILDQNIWARQISSFKSSVVRRQTPIKKKESYKWVTALRAVSERVEVEKTQSTKFVHIMDREADIYEVLCEVKDLNQDFIIRARNNRLVNKRSRASNDGILMSEALAKSKPLGRISIQIPTKNFLDKKRDALLEIRAQKVVVNAPRSKVRTVHDIKHDSIGLWVISVNEIPTKDVDEDELVNWTLLTNVSINSVEQVLLCLDYYCCRWQIEVYHRTLKTGCNVEKCRFSEVKKIVAYIAMMSIVAWRLHWMSYVARITPKGDVDSIFTKQEQMVLSMLVLKTKPKRSTTLIDYFILLARLGGFIARKGDGMPGAEVLWRGWKKLKEAINTWNALSNMDFKTYV